MSKFGKKIVLSYLIIVLFTVGISMGITKMNFSDSLNAKVVEDLDADAGLILEQIQKSLDNYRELNKKEASISELFLDNGVFFYNYYFSTHSFMVQDRAHNTVFYSWKNREGEDYASMADMSKHYIIMEKEIRSSDGKDILGYLSVIAEKEELGLISSLINRAAFMGLAISLACAILLAFIFERAFIRPINKLKRNIQTFSIDGENSWEEIHTHDEISDLNTEFKKMANNMVKYDKNQKEFFQNTSHELKTPLMSIQGYAEAIRDQIIPEEDVAESLNIIIDETNKLTNTVNSIVYMTKLDNPGKVVEKNRVQNLEMRDFVAEVLYKFKFAAEEKGVELVNRVDELLIQRVDEEYMFRIVNNLISNSLRYANQKIEVEAYGEGINFILKVTDDGQGFDDREIDRIFDRFYKGDRGNTGLGLAIVHSTVRQLKGKVEAYNVKPHGACVKITLPIASGVRKLEEKAVKKRRFSLERNKTK